MDDPLDLLHQAGAALCGPGWRRVLAARLGINHRTVERWANGRYDIPVGVWTELSALLLEASMSTSALARQCMDMVDAAHAAASTPAPSEAEGSTPAPSNVEGSASTSTSTSEE